MTRAAIVVILSMAVPLAVAAQQADAPRIYHAITIDRRSPGEKTLAERIARLDAALLVKVIREPRGVAVAVPRELLGPFADRPGVDPPPLVHTETAVEILEVFKGSPAAGVAGARMIIVTAGGSAEWKGGRAIGRVGPPPLRVGETYVVMLESTRADAPMHAYNSDIFRLVRGRLVAHGSAPLAWPFAREVLNLPWLEALAAFRAAAVDAESLN